MRGSTRQFTVCHSMIAVCLLTYASGLILPDNTALGATPSPTPSAIPSAPPQGSPKTTQRPTAKRSAPSRKKQPYGTEGLPTRPSAPPLLARRPPQDRFGCARRYVYDGKALNCDSYLYRDGEGLRLVLEGTPAALHELEVYQANRRRVTTLAYVGSIGLFIGLGAWVTSRFLNDSNGNVSTTGRAVRNLGGAIGITLIGSSLVIGLVSLHKNEDHLVKAVHLHNEAHPEQPIELQLGAEFTF